MLHWRVWAIWVRLGILGKIPELASFNLAIDSKLRGGDLVRPKVADVYAAGQLKHCASIVQSETRKPVSFENTEGTRKAVAAWLEDPQMIGSEHLWPARFHTGNLRAIQLLLGHTKLDSTVRYLGVELEDALTIAEAVGI